jgi:AcrR family transcriptional regulator
MQEQNIKLGLRETKYAQTKLSLLRAAADRLESRPLEEISIKEICEICQVSEATFFNYFPKKGDLILYYIQLWTLDMLNHARGMWESYEGLKEIEAVFDFSAERMIAKPGIMFEVIGYMARERSKIEYPPLTRAELYKRYPYLEIQEGLTNFGLESIIRPNLKAAVQKGELPPDSDLQTLETAILILFYGIPIVARRSSIDTLKTLFQSHLQVLWRAAKAGGVTFYLNHNHNHNHIDSKQAETKKVK